MIEADPGTTEDSQSAAGLPLSLWWHHPLADRSAQGLSDAVLRVQQRFCFDIVKMSPPGTYQAMDLGAVDAWCGGRRGYGMIVHRPLQTPADWERLAESAGPGPAVAEAMAAIPLVRAGLSKPRPILQTVFSPVALAEQLAGQAALRYMLRTHPTIAHAALRRLSACVGGTIDAALGAGATGVFYAIQQMRRGFFSKVEYDDLYRHYDAPCIQALENAPLNLVHVHGLDIHLPPMPLPANCWLHWETLAPNPTVRQVLERCPAPLALGLPGRLLADLARDDGIDDWLDGLLHLLNGRPGMLTPGCTLPLDMPAAVIDRWLTVRHRRSASPPPAAAAGRPTATARPSPKAAGELIAAACADVMRPGQERGADSAIKLLLRLEQDLRRPLPVVPFLADPLEPAILAEALARAPPLDAATPGARLPMLHILMEPGIPPDRLMGLARVLRGVADIRLIEFEPALWSARGEEARRRFAQSIAQQLGEGDEPLRLLGYGRGADILAWFLEAGGHGGRPVSFFGRIVGATEMEPARRSRPSPLRQAWMAWVGLAAGWDRPGLVTLPAKLAAGLGARRLGRALSMTAAQEAQRRGVRRLTARGGGAAWRFVLPATADGTPSGPTALLDLRTLTTLAGELAPALSDRPGAR